MSALWSAISIAKIGLYCMQYHAHLQYVFLKLHNANLPVYVSFYIIREIVHKQSLCTSHMNGKRVLSKLNMIFDVYKTDRYHGELDIYTNQLQQLISTCQVCYLEISDVKYQNVLLYILILYMQSSVCYRHHMGSKIKHYDWLNSFILVIADEVHFT